LVGDFNFSTFGYRLPKGKILVTMLYSSFIELGRLSKGIIINYGAIDQWIGPRSEAGVQINFGASRLSIWPSKGGVKLDFGTRGNWPYDKTPSLDPSVEDKSILLKLRYNFEESLKEKMKKLSGQYKLSNKKISNLEKKIREIEDMKPHHNVVDTQKVLSYNWK